ncbi:hypothetical protein [Niallia sp. Man26]|uniref:hypothetical protein n=1 Tax=Niallia sp. Man26 TaxID=2912824 RepID=UPI001EDB3ADD|nr:hypothetical protein [Niallia sp. Man26]UPO90463.1 hypothetical protein L8T27_020605 [Niallia sp. Man26]
MKIEEIRLDICSTYPISTKWFNGQITRDGALLLIETPQEEIDFSLSNQDCTITLIKDGNVRKIELKNIPISPTDADIFSDGSLLIVQGRCSTDGAKMEPNAQIYNLEGQLMDTFLLGDGISQVQIDETDTIWVSYFDEGIFGAIDDLEPMGADGLAAYSKSGQKLWGAKEYEMADCYAMNIVSSKEVNFYYYDQYKLVQLKDFMETACYVVEGDDTFQQFLFDQQDLLVEIDCDTLMRYNISNQTIIPAGNVTFVDEKGKRISGHVLMRGKLLYVFCKDRLYKKEFL